jgi:hypothetical protein
MHRRSSKISVHRTIRYVIASIVTLALILLLGGAAYTWFTDQNPAKGSPVLTGANNLQSGTSVTAVQPSANAKEGVAVESITSPVTTGTNASVTVMTNPNSACTILASYNKSVNPIANLSAKTADDYGTVSWTWAIDDSVPIGKWLLIVTCVYHGRSGVVEADLQVQK